MHLPDVRAYEGKEPFIFISYAHKDSADILPILSHLQGRGYRVWYDEGIAPGSEWPENIAQHLNDCAVVIAFVSNNSMASPNCRREITYALSKKKPFLGIFLEQAAMSPGMELQMSAQQCIIKYSYRNESMFYEKVDACPDLAPCRQAAPITIPEPPRPVAAPQSAPAQRPGVLQKKPWLWGIAGGIFAAVVLLIILLTGHGSPTDSTNPQLQVPGTGSSQSTPIPQTTAPTQPSQTEPTHLQPTIPTEPEDDDSTSVTIFPDKIVEKTETDLYLCNYTITDHTVRQIKKLTGLTSLVLRNCVFDATAASGLAPSAQWIELEMENCSGITDFSFLTECENLSSLILSNCGVSDSNFPQLTHNLLFQLSLRNSPGFTDLSKLSALPQLYTLDICGSGVTTLRDLPKSALTGIDFSNTAVQDISPLAQYPDLSAIFGDNTQVTDISPLAGLEDLRELSFSNNALQNITTPFYSLYLRKLYLSNCGLTDLSGFRHLTQLAVVDLSNNRLSDLTVLENSAETLWELSILNNPLAKEVVTALSAYADLRVLLVDGIALDDLDFCSSLTGLETLSASNCKLRDISGLASCPQLNAIFLSNNQISNVAALANLQTSHVILDLAHNQITDLSVLQNVYFKTLCLAQNEVLDLSTVTASGNTLLISYADNLEGTMPDNFYYYGILECPLEKRLTVKNALGSYSVTFLENEEDFRTMANENGLMYS